MSSVLPEVLHRRSCRRRWALGIYAALPMGWFRVYGGQLECHVDIDHDNFGRAAAIGTYCSHQEGYVIVAGPMTWTSGDDALFA